MSKVKLPFDCVIYDAEPALVKNPFSGEGVVLTPEAIAVYDTIKGCEMTGDYKMMEKGLRWFRQYFPAEYMILLD